MSDMKKKNELIFIHAMPIFLVLYHFYQFFKVVCSPVTVACLDVLSSIPSTIFNLFILPILYLLYCVIMIYLITKDSYPMLISKNAYIVIMVLTLFPFINGTSLFSYTSFLLMPLLFLLTLAFFRMVYLQKNTKGCDN